MKIRAFLLLLTAVLASLLLWNRPHDAREGDESIPASEAIAAARAKGLSEAIFAGGCFWCMEPPFDKLDGVAATISGYIGGHQDDPTYKQVSMGSTGHTEAVAVYFDAAKISYAELLDVFWRNIDPTVKDRQFCDWGDQYRTGIFYLDEGQGRSAGASKEEIVASGRFENVFTEVTEASTFYPAEEYHQDFYKKSPARYKSYRYGCGRDRRLAELWGED